MPEPSRLTREIDALRQLVNELRAEAGLPPLPSGSKRPKPKLTLIKGGRDG